MNAPGHVRITAMRPGTSGVAGHEAEAFEGSAAQGSICTVNGTQRGIAEAKLDPRHEPRVGKRQVHVCSVRLPSPWNNSARPGQNTVQAKCFYRTVLVLERIRAGRLNDDPSRPGTGRAWLRR